MNNGFEHLSPFELTENFFDSFGNKWALLTVTDEDGAYNTMTVSWGGVGILWGKPVAFIFIRPQRHTYSFAERSGRFSLCFLPDEMHDKLAFCGAHSGRDCDKARECGLTEAKENGATFFEEARLCVLAKKLYACDIEENNFIDTDILKLYNKDDFHRMYICEITDILKK